MPHMRFLREQDITFGPYHQIFRESRLIKSIPAALCTAALVALLYWAITTREVIPWVMAAGASLFALVFVNGFIHSFHRANWLIAANPSGLWLKIRAYDNDNMAPPRSATPFSICHFALVIGPWSFRLPLYSRTLA